MDYTITCPYCFKTFDHRAVHFRSENFTSGESPIPMDYDDYDDFMVNYKGAKKEEIIRKYLEWSFFAPKEDDRYMEFWERFGGPTESNPTDDRLGVKAYLRPIIDPGRNDHRAQLTVRSNGDPLIYDEDGFAISIQPKNGEITSRRVCPFCHNPLPHQYGKHDVKFVTVIGITSSGKTVYLSQLLKNLRNNAAKVGLNAVVSAAGAGNYVERNAVAMDKALPGATAQGTFEQPLFYDLIRSTDDGRKLTDTFVLYDVAGENCVQADYLKRFAPFIEHADGILLLIDPLQFGVIKGAVNVDSEASEPTKVLEAIHNVKSGGSTQKCKTPLAVCISKSDMEIVQESLPDGLTQMIMSNVTVKRDENGHGIREFDSENYNQIGMKLKQFVIDNELALEQMLFDNYSCYNYFAFSSLGCSVNSETNRPVGPILPKRIEEPLFWLFYEFNYIQATQLPIRCGKERIICDCCGGENCRKLSENERLRTVKRFLKSYTVYDTFECRDCGYRW